MLSDAATSIGPLDRGTIAPARALLWAKVVAVAFVALLALVGGTLLAPRVLAGVGVLHPVWATMTEISPIADTGGTGPGGVPTGRGCVASRVDLTWGAGSSGVARWCTRPGAARPTVGGATQIWVLPGWSPVQAGAAGPWLVFDIAALAVLLAGGYGAWRYGRELTAVLAIGRERVPSIALDGRIDRITIGRGMLGKDGRLGVRVAWASADYRPLRLALPGPVDRSLLGARVTVHALRATRGGSPGGPYVLVRSSGRRVALGRPIARSGARP